jgi:hypothetical protein
VRVQHHVEQRRAAMRGAGYVNYPHPLPRHAQAEGLKAAARTEPPHPEPLSCRRVGPTDAHAPHSHISTARAS